MRSVYYVTLKTVVVLVVLQGMSDGSVVVCLLQVVEIMTSIASEIYIMIPNNSKILT